METEDIANLSLDGGGEEGFAFAFDEGEGEVEDLRWCLLGRFLSDRVIHANSMMVRMANVWQPVKGVTIKETNPGLFLFRFNHALDMEAVQQNGPWTFDNNTLVLERVQVGTQIENIPLNHVDFWVQVHGLPMGLMKEKVGKSLGDYIGSLVEYDKNNNTSFWRQYMRLRVKIDVRLPLKKDTRVKDREGNWCIVKFKYEKLGTFCFICGIMGHSENRCTIRFERNEDDGVRGWSNEIRADTRRTGGRQGSRWLKEEGGGGQGGGGAAGGGGNFNRGGGGMGGGGGGAPGRSSGTGYNSGQNDSAVGGPNGNNASFNFIPNQLKPSQNCHINTFIPNNNLTPHNDSHSIPTLLQNNNPLFPPKNVTISNQSLLSSLMGGGAEKHNLPNNLKNLSPITINTINPKQSLPNYDSSPILSLTSPPLSTSTSTNNN
jgi:hypothetical protein